MASLETRTGEEIPQKHHGECGSRHSIFTAMTHLIVENRFIADYTKDTKPLLRCFVEAGFEGWAGYIFDLRQIDGRTNKPFLVFHDSVDSPEEGIATVDRVISRVLDRYDLPRQKLTWREVKLGE